MKTPEETTQLSKLTAKDNKAELALLAKMELLDSAGARRDFAKKIGVEWEEYLRFRRKWSRVLDRWKHEKSR